MEKIPLFKVFMSPSAGEKVTEVLNSGYIGQGEKVDQFEEVLRKHCQHDYISALNAGTSGLHLALRLLDLSPGDQILTSPFTCTATNWPILANGLDIKWVDIDPDTLNMDLDDLARKITPRTKAIMLVHWGGYPNDLYKINKILDRAQEMNGFRPQIIEDGAHSFGSRYMGKHIGTHGNLTMFSFQAIKHITSVDGGALLAPNKALHNEIRLLRWYGIDRDVDRADFRCEADIESWGYKFHMNDVSATVGIENMKHASEIISKHRSNAAYYDSNLSDVPGVKLLKREEGFDSAFWIYSMLVDDRAGFYRWMDECGIAVSQVHERNDKHTCVEEYKTPLPTLDKTVGNVVSIPVGWWVTQMEREHIVDSIKRGW